MPNAPAAIVPAPPVELPFHSLRNSVPVLTEVTSTATEDNRWGNGIMFEPDPCPDPTVWDPNCAPGTDPYTDEAGDFPGGDVDKSDPLSKLEFVEQWPFIIETAFSCATNVSVPYRDIAVRQLDRITDKTLEQELWTASATVGQNAGALRLALGGDATDVTPTPGTAVGASLSLQTIIQAISDCGPGGRGMIHATPSVVAGWAQDSMLDAVWDDGRPYLVTRIGHHIVVPGQGYPGTSPAGAAPDAGDSWVFATGMVNIFLGPVTVLEDDGRLRRVVENDQSRPTNEIELRAERAAALYFDTSCCAPLALLVEGAAVLA